MTGKYIKTTSRVWFGGDPEIFLSLDGQTVGSERAIPDTGLVHVYPGGNSQYAPNGNIEIIRDGVQIELNLPATFCREWLALEIKTAFTTLRQHLATMRDQKFEISFKQLVDVDPVELAKLTPLSRRLGCQPSFNFYTPGATIGVNPETYTKRSAGGHIHLGLPDHLMPERTRLAPLLDVLLGNTSVMIDRDPAQIERRQVYGRAGEFRLPRHGFEYRTLSNFWLRSKELVSLVTGLARMAVFVLDTTVDTPNGVGWPADEALLDTIDLAAIEKAINTNDVDLAKANFVPVAEFIAKYVPKSRSVDAKNETGLDSSRLAKFDKFIKGIDKGGIEYWFPLDPITHWASCDWMHGWESFLDERCASTE